MEGNKNGMIETEKRMTDRTAAATSGRGGKKKKEKQKRRMLDGERVSGMTQRSNLNDVQ